MTNENQQQPLQNGSTSPLQSEHTIIVDTKDTTHHGIKSTNKQGNQSQPPIPIDKTNNRIIMIATIVIAVATCFYVAFARLQWLTMSAQLSEMKSSSVEMGKQSKAMQELADNTKRTDETLRFRDRAFVYFLDPTFSLYPRDNPIVWAIGINLTNAGNMPARHISIHYKCFVSEKSQNIDPFPLEKWSSDETIKVIGPKQDASFLAYQMPIDTLTDIKKGKKAAYIVAQVKYIDGFDLRKLRVTQMSRRLFVDNQSHSFARVGLHNCADDDCPKQEFAKPK